MQPRMGGMGNGPRGGGLVQRPQMTATQKLSQRSVQQAKARMRGKYAGEKMDLSLYFLKNRQFKFGRPIKICY